MFRLVDYPKSRAILFLEAWVQVFQLGEDCAFDTCLFCQPVKSNQRGSSDRVNDRIQNLGHIHFLSYSDLVPMLLACIPIRTQ